MACELLLIVVLSFLGSAAYTFLFGWGGEEVELWPDKRQDP